MDLDQRINAWVAPVADAVTRAIFVSVPVAGAAVPLIVVWLIAAALFFTVYFGFANVTGFRHAVRLVAGRYDRPGAPGDISHFRSLATALSATVGIGNIAGVAIAISLGGPGATFWMILAGFFGMSSKFAECALAVRFRRTSADGTISGGPMYYLREGFARYGRPRAGRALAALFALCCVVGSLGIGNMFQGNQAVQIVAGLLEARGVAVAGFDWLMGLALAVAVGLVIVGGIHGIARVTARLVPFMALLYCGAALAVLVLHWRELPAAALTILAGAWSPEGVAGGAVGTLIQGVRRATFSNEAGIGSAAIAHSVARTDEPIAEGFVAMLGPFVDTVVICTLTALVVIVTGAYRLPGLDGIAITASAFASVWSGFPAVLALVVVLFAYSTIISWSFYGVKAFQYLAGDTPGAARLYRWGFLGFVVVGASLDLGAVVGFSDATIFAMALPNLIGVYLLAPALKGELRAYRARYAGRF